MTQRKGKPDFPTDAESIEVLEPGIYNAGSIGYLLKQNKEELEAEGIIADQSETDIAFDEEDREELAYFIEKLTREEDDVDRTDEGYQDIVIWDSQVRERYESTQ